MISQKTMPGKYGTDWNKDEVVLALALFKTGGVSHDQNDPKVTELARLIGRTPASVAMKLGNLQAVHTAGRKGLPKASRLDRQVWEEFQNSKETLDAEAHRIRTKLEGLLE